MDDFNLHQKKVELLQRARQQLNDEFLKNRNELHSKWQRESEAAWLTNGKLLPYPTEIRLYPTEKEVVARALEFYNSQVADNSLQQPVNDVQATSPWQTYLTPDTKQEEPKPEEPLKDEQTSAEDLKALLTKFLSLARELDAKKDANNV